MANSTVRRGNNYDSGRKPLRRETATSRSQYFFALLTHKYFSSTAEFVKGDFTSNVEGRFLRLRLRKAAARGSK